MKITNARLLKEFRTPGYCECCNLYLQKREPHHLKRKGMGGNGVLDIRINLIALGGIVKLPQGRERFLCRCHRAIHDGAIPASSVLAIVALREGTAPAIITEVVDWMRRLVKPTGRQLAIALDELSPPARAIALKELAEAPATYAPGSPRS
jgi:hypothetical protein